MQSLVQLPAAATGIFVLLASAALTMAGISLVTSGVRLRRAAIARRVNLIQPPRSAAVAETKSAAMSLVRAQRSGSLSYREQREVERQLAKLGLPASRAMAVYAILRIFAAIVFAILAVAAARYIHAVAARRLMMGLFTVGGALLGWLTPALVASHLVREHATAVAYGLPEALELLVICVEAGLSLEDGLDRIIGELKLARPALADELALTSADLKILPSRDQALYNLADRVDLPSVRSVVTTLSQTMRFGTPLAQALRVVASEMRNDALIAMEDRANRLPALLTVPMMLFIMPTIFLIVGGPAALRVMDIFYK